MNREAIGRAVSSYEWQMAKATEIAAEDHESLHFYEAHLPTTLGGKYRVESEADNFLFDRSGRLLGWIDPVWFTAGFEAGLIE
jgi:hypothetical protein